MKIKTITSLKNIRGKTVLVRDDFNVPVFKGKVQEEYKIEKSLPTIAYLLREGAKVILVSHLGRPKGKYEKKYSLKPVADSLKDLLKTDIKFLADKKCDEGYWDKAKEAAKGMRESEVMLLENIRFFPGEEKNDKKLAKHLADLADAFVLDGFGVAHREASSVSGVAELTPSCAGILLEEEIKGLVKVLKNPKKPLVIVLAGVKIETKIPVLKKLLPLADHILIGGGVLNTYLAAQGRDVGTSLIDKDYFAEAKKYCANKKIVLPVDVIVGRVDGKKAKAVKLDNDFGVKENNFGIYDIGPQTIKLFSKYIKSAQTLVWNGAMGFFEKHPYEYGTYSMARLVAARSMGKSFGVSGGGETVEILRKLKLMEDV
ncbi:MAG: phosphoglycerate kinase, partial [Candidatus Paceibacterota bacterium]